MKKLLLFVTMAASLLFTQCKKDDKNSMPSAGKPVRMTVTAGPGRTDVDTETGAITWSEGDKLYVSDGTKWLGSLTLVGKGGSAQGTFTGNITSIDETKPTCHFFYLGRDNGMTEPTANTSTVADISFASQDGTLAGAMKYHMGYGNTNVTMGSVAYEGYVVMDTKIAIAHFNFITDGTNAYTEAVTMIGVSNKLSVNPDGTFSGSGNNGITIGNGDGTTGERYVTLIPSSASQVSVAFNSNVTGSMTFGQGIRENKFYGMSKAIDVTLKHEVNMGLKKYPNLEWSVCNLGATNGKTLESWSGDYYQWGSLTPVTSTTIAANWAICPGNGGDSNYNVTAFNEWIGTYLINKYVLKPEVDVAHSKLGGDWRMPTTDEWNELYNNTTTEVIENYNGDGFYVRVFRSKDGKGTTLILPYNGYRKDKGFMYYGGSGFYWSSNLYSNYDSAYSMFFGKGYVTQQGNSLRYFGYAVRPVRDTK